MLLVLVRRGNLACSHIGTPCQSVTLARKPALRNDRHPCGLPGLSRKQQAIVDAGNALFAFTVLFAVELWLHGGFFCIENPDQSFLWLQPLILSLTSLDGVGFIRFVMRSYGSIFQKPVDFLANISGMEQMACVPEHGEPGPLLQRAD